VRYRVYALDADRADALSERLGVKLGALLHSAITGTRAAERSRGV